MPDPSPRVGVIGVEGGWSSESLADAIGERTGYRLLVDMDHLVADLCSGKVLYGDVDLCGLDGLVIKKAGAIYSPDMLDRLELLRYVAESGVRVFSRPASIIRLLDRLSCTITLSAAGIPLPETVVTENLGHAVDAIQRFGCAVLKPLYSTKARGMLLLDTEGNGNVAERVREFRDDGNPVLYIQKKVHIAGRDLGVVFLGGRYLGAYARVSAAGAWNTTIRAGGHYEPHHPGEEVVEIARRAQELFDLDFTSVDVALTDDGPVVFEVSAFGGFRGMREGLGLDAAALYSDYVVEQLSNVRAA